MGDNNESLLLRLKRIAENKEFEQRRVDFLENNDYHYPLFYSLYEHLVQQAKYFETSGINFSVSLTNQFQHEDHIDNEIWVLGPNGDIVIYFARKNMLVFITSTYVIIFN